MREVNTLILSLYSFGILTKLKQLNEVYGGSTNNNWVEASPVLPVGVGDPSNNQLGSSVVERFACDEVVPGSIPGLAYSFLFLHSRPKVPLIPSPDLVGG